MGKSHSFERGQKRDNDKLYLDKHQLPLWVAKIYQNWYGNDFYHHLPWTRCVHNLISNNITLLCTMLQPMAWYKLLTRPYTIFSREW